MTEITTTRCPWAQIALAGLNLAWYVVTTMCEGCDMTEITTTRCPWARIALAGLNTGHPGPMPRGTMGSGRCFAGYKGQ